jgi:hypothetical protein
MVFFGLIPVGYMEISGTLWAARDAIGIKISRKYNLRSEVSTSNFNLIRCSLAKAPMLSLGINNSVH